MTPPDVLAAVVAVVLGILCIRIMALSMENYTAARVAGDLETAVLGATTVVLALGTFAACMVTAAVVLQ